MRFNTEETADFATLDEAFHWVEAQKSGMLEIMEVNISNRRRGIKDLFTKNYLPYSVTVRGTVVTEEHGE